ncbi:HAD family hydrolase [Methanocella arvoryzae]|uniref:Hydrolase (HAD superfamily) n=1 Tax=Methanocella arvoryzae (strain DSM 22066 / NBRC 105507 / MRE50) TaxID=351160 RepID=Q0W1T2_METAR|nr:HAD family hydrolase [Methanocella arvoryzae]CAJ37661.1 putative hydrolase (HAD superfamily) [Methanocella arvoryzae MRE50]
MSEIKGLIFDLDGTIIDNYDRYLEHMLTCVGNDLGFCFTLGHAKDLWYSIGAESRDQVIHSWGLDPDRFWTAFNRHESLEKKIENTYLYKDALFLASLKIPKGIVTHTSLEHTTRLLEHVGMREHFDPIIACTEETGFKPSPLPLIYCLMEMQIKPEEAVYVGDTWSDMMAARNAGIKSVYVNRFNRPIDFVPDYEIDSLEKIAGIVEACCPELLTTTAGRQ